MTDAKFEKFDWKWVRAALLNVNTIFLSLNFFLIITPIYSYSLFLPTIISGLGYEQVHAQLLTVPPNMAAFLLVLAVTWASDRTRRRGWFMLGGVAVAIGGYIMLIATPNTLVQYGGTFLVAGGIFPCSPIVMGWLANNLAPHYVRATGTGFQIMIANFAAFIATFTYLKEDACVAIPLPCRSESACHTDPPSQTALHHRPRDQPRHPRRRARVHGVHDRVPEGGEPAARAGQARLPAARGGGGDAGVSAPAVQVYHLSGGCSSRIGSGAGNAV